MKKFVLLSIMLLISMGMVFAGGTTEKKMIDNGSVSLLPGDSSSTDAILQQGLPALSNSPVKVDYLTIWTSGKSADAESEWLEKELTSVYPQLTVEIERLGTNPLKEAATIRVIAGTPPTIARISGGYAIDEFIRQGILQDVTKYWEQYDLENLVPPALANAFKFNGRYYGFPFSDAPQAFLFWNKDAFVNAGVPQPPYDTWDDFFAAAQLWKTKKPDVPFYTYSLNPGWYGLERAFIQAATRFGKDFMFRIFNGEATVQDYTDLLEFNKRLISVSNQDYVSVEGTKGVQELVIRGDAALCYSGSWGYAAFVAAGIQDGLNLGYSLLPGYPMQFSTMSGLVVFANSGKESAGEVIGVHSMLKDIQLRLNLLKDNIPARSDVDISAADGWSSLVSYVADQVKQGAEVIPRANSGFPSTVLSSMEPVFVSCMTGKTSIADTARKLVNIQDQNKEKFSLIRW